MQDDPLKDAVEPRPALNETPPTEPMAAQEPTLPPPPAQPITNPQYIPPGKPKGKPKNWGMIAAIALAVIVIAAAAYLLLKPKPAAKTTAKTTTTQQQATAQAATPLINATTKSYNSTNFNLSFKYPEDWTVTDAGNGTMTVKSPSLQLKNPLGSTVTGQIELSVRSHGQTLPEFAKGAATATRDSVKIAYTSPTQNQRASTYISFLQYFTTTTKGGLDGVYITGDNGYTKDQDIPAADIGQEDPLISITFLNTVGGAMSVADSMWDTTSFATPLTTMLESFSIN